MSEEVQGQAVEQDQAQEAPKADYDAIKAQVLEEVKSEMSGLHRKIGELTKEKEEKARAAEEEAKAKLSVSERLAKMEQELEASRNAAEEEKLKSIMTKKAVVALEEAGLPQSIIEKINIASEDAIAADVVFYSELFSGYEQTAKDEVRKKHAFKPSGGEAKHSVPKSLAECKTKEDKIAYLKSMRG